MRKLAEGLFLAEEYKIYGHQLIEEYKDEEVEDDLFQIKKGGKGIERQEEEEEEEKKNIQEEEIKEEVVVSQDDREAKELIDKLGQFKSTVDMEKEFNDF